MSWDLISQKDSSSGIMKLKNAEGIIYLSHWEVAYIKASNKHSLICKIEDKSTVEVYHPLKYFTETLLSPVFFRCHDSYLVNLDYFKSVFNNEIVLADGIRVPLSRYKKEELKEHIRLILNEQRINQSLQI